MKLFVRIMAATMLTMIAVSGYSWPGPAKLITPTFFEILRSGDAKRLNDALTRENLAGAVDKQGNTALMISAIYGDVRCMAVLLQHGADVNATNAAGATALMRAAFALDKVKLLLEHGAELNVQSARGNSALILAARPADSFRVVQALLEHGAKINLTNIGGATALISASAGGNKDSVQILLAHGAVANAAPTSDFAGFAYGGGRSALMWAAFRGDTELAASLLDAGAEVNGEASLGSALSQAAWGNQIDVASLLLKRGAAADQVNHFETYTALHWASSSEFASSGLVNLLLHAGANPNKEGGDNVDALMIPQTPLMLARHRGATPVLASLIAAGATNETRQQAKILPPAARSIAVPDKATRLVAMNLALKPLERTAIESKKSFLRHNRRQDCLSCHQQYLPLAAFGRARKSGADVDPTVEQALIKLMAAGENADPEVDGQVLFHPAVAHGKGYYLFGYANDDLAATEVTDGYVHHLAVVQCRDGRWLNNMPRPPIQSGDVDATALAIHALQKYPLPGRKLEFAERIERARRWLWSVKAESNEERVYQLLGLFWAGEKPAELEKLSGALLARQSSDGGWSQLNTMKSDAYATGQAIYALNISANLSSSDPHIRRALQFLLLEQRNDGTWYVARRAFPFQPTMDSGFPYGRDSWLSAAATSWAVIALSIP